MRSMLEPHKLMLSRKVVGVWLLLCLLSIENYLRDQRNIRRQLQRPQEVRSEPDEANVLMAVIPNVLIAGAQKGGTTSIAHYLHSQHGACFSDPNAYYAQGEGKEAHFFDIPSMRQNGLPHYQRLFSHCHNATLVIDGTPEYMKFPKRIRQIYDEQGTADQLKIIFTLREPVSREISWYQHRLRDCKTEAYARGVCDNNGNPKTFGSVMQSEVMVKLRHQNYNHMYSTYAQYLTHWFEEFDRSTQILILSYDEAKSDPNRFLQRIHEFLQLPLRRWTNKKRCRRKTPTSRTSLRRPVTNSSV